MEPGFSDLSQESTDVFFCWNQSWDTIKTKERLGS